jgi:hypothetical protein
MRYTQALRGLLLNSLILLGSCGGGGGGGGSGGPIAPSGLSYPTAPAFVVGQAITPLTPTVSGQVASYSVDQSLPAGLTLSTSSGVISGTPTTATAQANYTVHAQNAAGSIATTVAIVVNAPPALGYSSPAYTFTANLVAQAITPTPSGSLGNAVTWSVSPALPAGLVLDPTNGTLGGTPTAASASASYTVTAGSGTATLTISVAAAPVLDLGHTSQIIAIRTNATRVLSLDATGHWLLKDVTTGNTLVSGDHACGAQDCTLSGQYTLVQPAVDMAGSVMMDNAPSGLEIRSSSDGHVITTIPGTFSWYSLSADGSYVATGNATALAAWSTTSGQSLFSRPGNYSTAAAFATATAILVAKGPAGQSVIETVSVPNGTSSLATAFQGTFQTWFADGSHFLTTLGNALWTYSNASVQADLTQVSAVGQLGGEGQWFWNGSNIYKVGASTSPALTVNGLIVPSGSTLGVIGASQAQASITIVDLSGTTPVSNTHAISNIATYPSSAFSAVSPTSWFIGNSDGVLADGSGLPSQSRYLTLGRVKGIAGGSTYFALSTSIGNILFFDSATNTQVGAIDLPASQLSVSSTGSVLAAVQPTGVGNTATLNVYSLPSVTPASSVALNTAPYYVRVSGTGNVLAERFQAQNTDGCFAEVVPIAGGAPSYCDTTGTVQDLQVSPDGTLVAAQIGGQFAVNLDIMPPVTTSIYQNGTLLTSVPGLGKGWLDNGHLLAQIYDNHQPTANYVSSAIYNPQGTVLSTPALPVFPAIIYGEQQYYGLQWFRLTSTPLSTVFVSSLTEIFSLTTGRVTWASGDLTTGAAVLAGTNVVFVSGTQLLAQPY